MKANFDAGSAGQLQLQLVDTAANTGAGQPIAHASADLDMRQWKDSQTYQAQVPLASEEVRSHPTYPEVESSMRSCNVWQWQLLLPLGAPASSLCTKLTFQAFS